MNNMPFDERDALTLVGKGHISTIDDEEEKEERDAERARVKARAAARAARSEELRLLNGFEFFHNDKEYKIQCEVVKIIFSHFNHESLLACHLVCKKWKALIQNHVWRMKAELAVHENFSHHHNVPWQLFHMICITNRNPFEKNLLKNHSGENGLEHWTTDIPQLWTVENPPVGVPELPVDEDPTFEGKQFCFATNSVIKSQTVDLVDAGFSSYILDNFRLPIKLTGWYCGLEGFILDHKCKMLTDNNKPLTTFKGKRIEPQKNKWIKDINEYKYCANGFRKISFSHSVGAPSRSLSCKMAGACLKIKFPYTTANGHFSDNQ